MSEARVLLSQVRRYPIRSTPINKMMATIKPVSKPFIPFSLGIIEFVSNMIAMPIPKNKNPKRKIEAMVRGRFF